MGIILPALLVYLLTLMFVWFAIYGFRNPVKYQIALFWFSLLGFPMAWILSPKCLRFLHVEERRSPFMDGSWGFVVVDLPETKACIWGGLVLPPSVF